MRAGKVYTIFRNISTSSSGSLSPEPAPDTYTLYIGITLFVIIAEL
jgi:hypothetical protein